jgi:hypothetical protein
MSKNVIVYTLWGDKDMYWKGAVENIKLSKIYYPGWINRFYIDEECDTSLIEMIKGDNVEIILMKPDNGRVSNIDRFNHSGLFWRFLSLESNDVDVLISRDCDSRISKREVCAVNEWLESNKDFHIMRDHPYHAVPILSGMWGCKNKALLNIKELLDIWNLFPNKGLYNAEDQDFLGQLIYPIIKDKALEHCDFNLNFGGRLIPFPTKRENCEFVGDVFDEANIRHPEHWQILKKYYR